MRTKIFLCTLFLLAGFVLEAKADTIYLKNGRKMEGRIKRKNEKEVWLDIGAGSVKFNWEQIDSIQILSPDGTVQEIKQGGAIGLEKGAERKLPSDKETVKEMIAEAEAFNVSYPSDWKKELKEGILTFKGPFLDGTQRPYIVIMEEKDDTIIRSMEKIKKDYYRWKDLPAVKEKMMEFAMPFFYSIHGLDNYKFLSCDYEEKGDFVIQHLVSLEKTLNIKMCNTGFITKTEPTKGYSLIFFCSAEYYDEYFPVFKKCLDSFSIKE